MASTISAGITTTTALSYSADTSGVLQLQTNGGTTAVTIDTNQNVGIGVTPSVWGLGTNGHALEFSNAGSMWNYSNTTGINLSQNVYYNGAYYYKSTAAATLYGQGSGQHLWYNAPSGTAGTTVTLTQAMTLDINGNLLVGTTTSAGDKLTIANNGAGTSAIRFIDTNTSGKNWVMGPGTGTGAVTDFGWYNITNSNAVGRATSSGVWYQGNNSASWSIVSDERIKENINTLNNGLSVITALRPVEFDYKISKAHDIGFIAQEYQKVLPEQINENEPTNETKEFIEDNKLLGISSNLVPYLVLAIQELSAQVTTLQTQVTALKG